MKIITNDSLPMAFTCLCIDAARLQGLIIRGKKNIDAKMHTKPNLH